MNSIQQPLSEGVLHFNGHFRNFIIHLCPCTSSWMKLLSPRCMVIEVLGIDEKNRSKIAPSQKNNNNFFFFFLILTISVWLLQTICAMQSMQSNAVCSVLIHNKLSRLFSLLFESLGQIKGTVCHVSQADQISLELVDPKVEAEPLTQTQCSISPFLLYCLLCLFSS